MPPKRKRTDNSTEASSRVTRATANVGHAAIPTGSDGSGGDIKNVRNSKKAKTAPTEKRAGKVKKGEQQKGAQEDTSKVCDGDSDTGKQEPEKETETRALRSHNSTVLSAAKFDPKQALALFAKYVDSDNPDLIGPEGFETLCNDAQIPLDGAMAIILSWQLNAKEMAKLTKEAWTKETSELKVSSLPQLNMIVQDINDLLILRRPALQCSASKNVKDSNEPYNRIKYWSYAEDSKKAFQELYTFSFSLAKPQHSRNIDIETAVALWSVLLVPVYPLMGDVLTFITEKMATYKAANKDIWNMMLEFCQTVDTNLQGYDSDSAWPTLLDDFVAWKKSKQAS